MVLRDTGNDDDGNRDSGDSGGGRFGTKLMGRKAAIRFINPMAMEERAYEYVYKHYIERNVRSALRWTVAHQAKYRKHPQAEKLNVLVQEANDCTRPPARKHIKQAVSRGLISEEKDGVSVFYFLTPKQIEKAEQVLAILDLISEVVRLQVKEPLDKEAGKKLIPAEVYYNVIDEFDDED